MYELSMNDTYTQDHIHFVLFQETMRQVLVGTSIFTSMLLPKQQKYGS